MGGTATTRPYVVVHNVASLDGRLTLAPGMLLMEPDSRWQAVAGAEDPYQPLFARYAPQAILEGAGSFVVEEAPPTGAEAEGGAAGDFLPASVVGEPGRRWFVVPDSRGRVRWQFKEFPGDDWRGWHLLVLVAASTPAAYRAFLRDQGIPHLVAGTARVDLRRALERLTEDLGVTSLVSTGGGRLHGALLRAGLVDAIDIAYFPALIGGRGTPSLFDAPPLADGERPAELELLGVEVEGTGWLRARYRVARP